MASSTPRYIVDAKGRKRAVILPISEYNRLIERLEELDDALALDEGIQNAQEFIDYEDIREELKKEGRL